MTHSHLTHEHHLLQSHLSLSSSFQQQTSLVAHRYSIAGKWRVGVPIPTLGANLDWKSQQWWLHSLHWPLSRTEHLTCFWLWDRRVGQLEGFGKRFPFFLRTETPEHTVFCWLCLLSTTLQQWRGTTWGWSQRWGQQHTDTEVTGITQAWR